MKATNLTLLFNGQAEAAFTFYKQVFGGEFISVQRLKDAPGMPDMPADVANKILHMALPVGNMLLAGMDCPPQAPSPVMGSNFFVTLDTESVEETTKLFNALSEGGTVMMPLADQFWGAFFGMFTDKFGIQWMVSYRKED